MERRCPRCPDTPLAVAAGALHEDACGDCGGRFLDDQALLLLCERHLRVSLSTLKELTREGPRRLACPGCASRMTLTLLRGVPVDLCAGCGGAWLDQGELSNLTRGHLPEIAVQPLPLVQGTTLLDEARVFFGEPAAATTVATTVTTKVTTMVTVATTVPPAGRRAIGGWEVRCVSCDEPLDLGGINWLINQRPWCAACAAPHTGVAGVLDVVAGVAGGLLGRRQRRTSGPSLVDAVFDGVDALRIGPAHVEVHFGPFFRPVAPPAPRDDGDPQGRQRG